MTQANESLDRTAADHIRALYDHAGCPLFDYALINRQPASPRNFRRSTLWKVHRKLSRIRRRLKRWASVLCWAIICSRMGWRGTTPIKWPKICLIS